MVSAYCCYVDLLALQVFRRDADASIRRLQWLAANISGGKGWRIAHRLAQGALGEIADLDFAVARKANMDFRNWILESFTPVVMVVASAEAEAMVAEQNGLTVVDMLRPYGYFHHLSGMRLQLHAWHTGSCQKSCTISHTPQMC